MADVDAGVRPDKGTWVARAAACELLALSFSYPDNVLVDAIVSGEYAAAAAEIAAALGIARDVWDAEPLARYFDADSDALRRALRIEHSRLFLGSPNTLVPPYEGMWRAADDGVEPLLFVNPHTIDVKHFCRASGVDVPEGTNEPIDHISRELGLLHYLAMVEAGLMEPGEGAAIPHNAYGSFFVTHFSVWAGRFADAIVEKSREEFFTRCARFLKDFVEFGAPGE